MSEARLPVAVKDFVLRHITSVEQLELLLLFAADPARKWTIPELVKQFQSSESSVGHRIAQLLEGGFLAKEGDALHFQPRLPEYTEECHQLAAAYREYRVRIIELIYSGAGPLKSFSDAFKFNPNK